MGDVTSMERLAIDIRERIRGDGVRTQDGGAGALAEVFDPPQSH